MAVARPSPIEAALAEAQPALSAGEPPEPRRRAFGQFYRDNLRALRAYVARLLPGTSDAEDIANEAFTNVYAVVSADRPLPPKAYLYTAAHNLALNHKRRHRTRGEPGDFQNIADLVADNAPSAERMLLDRERVAQLQKAFAQLSPLRRYVIYLRKIELLKNKEIAHRLGMSVSAVEKHIRYGLRSCQAYLDASDRSEGKGADHV